MDGMQVEGDAFNSLVLSVPVFPKLWSADSWGFVRL